MPLVPACLPITTASDIHCASTLFTDDRKANPLSSPSRKRGGVVQFPLGGADPSRKEAGREKFNQECAKELKAKVAWSKYYRVWLQVLKRVRGTLVVILELVAEELRILQELSSGSEYDCADSNGNKEYTPELLEYSDNGIKNDDSSRPGLSTQAPSNLENADF
ncbi:hypothetical protein TNCT_160041 [Trichonephila clavata]|uniref:Uncharacterized protein n=1 Tax=Trichonephila clavata TaxID=2740835 RepID=A0A8X6FFV8_TRICU|nr:hypothetical protein TNCT_160041 [Trichonephila clavata]